VFSQPFRAKALLADQNSGRAIASPATSLALMVRARAWEWDKDPLFEEGNRGVEKNSMSPVIGGFCLQLVL
jgi:hypothetical protein